MSTNKTTNYNLHAWVPEDDFLRSEFNDNFAGIDAALKSLSDSIAAEAAAREAAVSAEAAARQSAVSAEQSARQSAITTLTTGKAEIVAGSYEGDGAVERTITLGFQPKAVLIMQDHGRTYVNISNSSGAYGGLFVPGHPLRCSASGDDGIAAEVVSTGFKVYSRSYAETNNTGYTYCYIAVK